MVSPPEQQQPRKPRDCCNAAGPWRKCRAAHREQQGDNDPPPLRWIRFELILVSQGTALHYAVGKGHLEVARALLDASAPTEARNSVGETPMHRCCTARAHAAELVQLLVAHKANVNARNK